MKGDRTFGRDFTKLSKDGFDAFRDMRLARLAIFDGHTDDAKTLVKQAAASLGKSSKDDSVFSKAASDITPPLHMTEGQQERNNDTTQVKWIPIDGQMALTEGYDLTPEKTAAIGKANQALKGGDRKAAVDTLKLAGINMNYVMTLAPIDKTTKSVDQASSDLQSGKFYEANLDLKKIEDSVVYDSIDVVGTPAAATKTDQSAKTTVNGSNAPSQPKVN
ncbi:YfdX family protein [Rhizobium sp. BR 315]|uniref:YfdX family protein n=1 Tax=Rhizobium sp. BR 315 TaxID=3040014 RepID=UPI003D33496F